MIRRFIYVILVAVNFSFAVTAQYHSSGSGIVANTNGVNALFTNAAALSTNEYHELYGGYSRIFLGLDSDNIRNLYIGYSTPNYRSIGFGLGYKQLSSDAFTDLDISFAIGSKYQFSKDMFAAIGITSHLCRYQYSLYDPYDPVFSDKDNQMSFGMDLSTLITYKNLSIGGSFNNLIAPDMSILDNSSSDYTIKKPRCFDAGITYKFSRYNVYPSIGLTWEENDPENSIHPSFGLEAHFINSLISLRTNVSDKDFSLGIGINPLMYNRDVTFDYAYNHPNDILSEAGISNHHIGMGIKLPRLSNKPNLMVDISAKDSSQSTQINIKYYRDEEKIDEKTWIKFEIVGPVEHSDSVLVSVNDTSQHIYIVYEPPKPGEYTITATIDPQNTIRESNEYDNSSTILYTAIGKVIEKPKEKVIPIMAEIGLKSKILNVTDLYLLSEEEPFLPIIFFDSKSSELPTRFNRILDIMALRIRNNPDIKYNLYGFVDNTTDSNNLELSYERSQNVKRALMDRGVEGKQIVIVRNGYEPQKPKSALNIDNLSEDEVILVQDENRRVEIISTIEGKREINEEWKLSSGKFGIDSFLNKYAKYICNNPDLATYIEWIISYDSYDNYSTINDLRIYIQKNLEKLCRKDINRIPILLSKGEKERIVLSLSADKLVYEPISYKYSAKDFSISENELINSIGFVINRTDGIKKLDLYVTNAYTNERIRTLYSGEGVPKGYTNWDWKDSENRLVDPFTKYFITIDVFDSQNKDYQFTSDTISIIPHGSFTRYSTYNISQFNFDGLSSESKYLESRIDNIANKIINISNDQTITSAKISIIGHSDPIGSENRNKRLSENRARKEYNRMKIYIASKLGLPSVDKLDEWLLDNNIVIEATGMSDTAPYEIELFNKGAFIHMEPGNNKLPEGRSLNRRVVIEIEENFITN